MSLKRLSVTAELGTRAKNDGGALFILPNLRFSFKGMPVTLQFICICLLTISDTGKYNTLRLGLINHGDSTMLEAIEITIALIALPAIFYLQYAKRYAWVGED